MSQNPEALSPVLDVTAQVRDFYERHPYPPPIDNLDKYRRLWQDPQRRRAEYHLFWPSRPYREDQSILIAGCGTSQAAKHALRWPGAQMIGIDCSAQSIFNTEELKRKYNLKNLQVRQLAIEQVSDLEMNFDHIVCTGVLHHLANPDAGLSALRRVLKPDGALHLMVYAPYGRTGIYMLQEFCRRIGIQANEGEIRDLIVALSALPPGHPLEGLLKQAPDFRHESAIADALLHPQDRAYSVPQLFDFIDQGGMKFGRWIRQAPYSLRCGAMARIPQAARMADLPLPEHFAAIELFRGTMARHSVVAYRKDSVGEPQHLNYSSEAFLAYVPIRMPDTICIQDRLPPGAAAVLINQSHTYKDIFLPIESTEKGWFDAIDGIQSIKDIVERRPSSSNRNETLGMARNFFEQLWWHDQVVFDTSAHPTAV